MAMTEVNYPLSGGGTPNAESGIDDYIEQTTGTTVDTLHSTIKASSVQGYIIKGANFGVIGAKFDSSGNQTDNWYGDTYSSGRFLHPHSSITIKQNADNTINITRPSSTFLGGGKIYWCVTAAE